MLEEVGVVFVEGVVVFIVVEVDGVWGFGSVSFVSGGDCPVFGF